MEFILVDCYFRDIAVTGFQMVAQLSSSSQVYTNKTTDHQTPASVEVEESGMYQVTIFAIRGERGILDSTVEYNIHNYRAN